MFQSPIYTVNTQKNNLASIMLLSFEQSAKQCSANNQRIGYTELMGVGKKYILSFDYFNKVSWLV